VFPLLLLHLVEFATVTKDADGAVVYHVFSKAELEQLIKDGADMLKALEPSAAGDI